MGLLREQCAEWKKVRLRYCCNQVWMKNGGQIPWNALPICETFMISCLMGRLHSKDVLENLCKGPSIPFGSLVEYYTISAKDQSRIHQFGKKVSPGLFLGYALYAVWNLERWRTDCRQWGVGDDGRIRNLLKTTQCKGSNISKENGQPIFPVADGRIKFVGGDQELRTSTLIREHPVRGEDQRDFLGESEGSPPPQPHDSLPDAGEARNDFWSMSGNFKNRHHVEPRVKLYSPREESFPIPLKYIDVSRTTQTNLDVMQESRIDDYWNIDGSRDLSDWFLDRFHPVYTLLSEKPPEGYIYLWSGGRLTKRHSTSRPDHLWPELWGGMARNAKLTEKHKWAIEKPKLDNARRLRGIYFIDPEDMEFKGIIRNVRKKWKHQWLPQCLARHSRKASMERPVARLMISSLNLRVSWKPVNSLRMEESLPNYHQDHIAGTGDHSLQHYNLVHKFIPMSQAMKIPAAKSNSGKRMWKTWKDSYVGQNKCQKQIWRDWWDKKRRKKYTSLHWWTSVIWRMPSWRQSTKNTKVELYSEATLWKMILALTQYSPSKDHQVEQDKPQTQYPFTYRSKWKMHRR